MGDAMTGADWIRLSAFVFLVIFAMVYVMRTDQDDDGPPW